MGADLMLVVDQLGGKIESVEELTRLQSPNSDKACFKLQFKDGRTVKGRRFRSTEQRKSVTALIQLLEGLPFSRVIVAHGVATIEEWIMGTPLQVADMNADHIRHMAAILASLHSIPYFRENCSAHVRDIGWYFNRMRNQLAELVNQGSLEPDALHNLVDLSENSRPMKVEVGVIHTDFHPRNMVINQGGEIWIVDNEDIRLGVLDYDIARCWRQWPMTCAQREVFCTAYSKFRSLDAFIAHQIFWTICTLAVTAHIQGRHGRPILQFVAKLKRISKDAGENLWPELPMKE